MSNKTIYLDAYTPAAFEIKTVFLELSLYEMHTDVTNTMSLVRRHPGELRLSGEGLELTHIEMNGHVLGTDHYRFESNDLIITPVSNEFTLTITTKIYPHQNTALSGLYRSHDLFCTQCEAEGFRRITYFLDRPDVLSIYTTRISADKAKYPVLLSNGNKIDSGKLSDGRHFATWQDPFKKPSYLFALVAGNLACVKDEFLTCSGRTIDLRLYVEPGNEDKCQHALDSLKRAMRWDEQAYGREYDLDIFMIVAVSDFNMGAMENKGLNIFNAKYILASPDTASDVDYADIEGVVAHEYFHNWTGNRVTCRDWFQLSLKEGLTVFRDQEFSRDMHSRDVNRIMDVNVLRQTQFPEDAGRMAHPVRPSSYQEINNFYTATIYNKGAEVIRMQETLLGKAGFRRGMDLYFERHDGSAVTINDFVAAMSDANGVDLKQFMHWYSQAGTPHVKLISEVYADGQLTLSFTQTCAPTPECAQKLPFVIPLRVALYNAKGESMPIEKSLLVLNEATQSFVFEGLSEKPIVSLLQDFSAPIRLERTLSRQEQLTLLRYETNGFAKWDVSVQLAKDVLISLYQNPRETWQVPADLFDAYRHILTDDSLDMALRAELIMPPGFEEVASAIPLLDVARLEDARAFFRDALSLALKNEAYTLYNKLWAEEDHTMHSVAYRRRRLRHVALWLLMKSDHEKASQLCEQQFIMAQTMTDQIGSFGLLVNGHNETLRIGSIDRFYQQWKGNALVLDKWFGLQASSDHSGALDRVKQLLKHPDFNFKNPNKVRAVIGAFCQGNPRHFHAIDGQGYAFLTDCILELDAINPQIAARLATPFTRWQRYDKTRQDLMLQQLTRLASVKLSRDVSELVHKSLEK